MPHRIHSLFLQKLWSLVITFQMGPLNRMHYFILLVFSVMSDAWAPAGFFPGVSKLKGLEDGSFPAGFRGRTLVGASG